MQDWYSIRLVKTATTNTEVMLSVVVDIKYALPKNVVIHANKKLTFVDCTLYISPRNGCLSLCVGHIGIGNGMSLRMGFVVTFGLGTGNWDLDSPSPPLGLSGFTGTTVHNNECSQEMLAYKLSYITKLN